MNGSEHRDIGFEPGGRFADFDVRCRGTSGAVERRVRDRYLMLAATNDDHFVAPGGITHERHLATPAPSGSAVRAGSASGRRTSAEATDDSIDPVIAGERVGA